MNEDSQSQENDAGVFFTVCVQRSAEQTIIIVCLAIGFGGKNINNNKK